MNRKMQLRHGNIGQEFRAQFHAFLQSRPSFTFLLLIYAAYMVAAKVGQGFAIIPGIDITFWPPAGLMIGILLVCPRRFWPWLLLVGMVGEATANELWFKNPYHFTALYILGNVLEVTGGALIYARLSQTPDRVNTLRETLAFVLMALAAPVAGATIIAFVDAFIAQKHNFLQAWGLVWLGDATGILAATPMVIVAERIWSSRHDLSRLRILEATLVIIAATVVFIAAMYTWQQFAYANLPLLAWLAVRTRFAGTAIAIALLTVVATVIVSNRMGVFAGNPDLLQLRVVFVQSYVGVSALVSLLVAVLAQQYEETLARLQALNRSLEDNVAQRSESLRETDEKLQLALEAAESGTWSWDESSRQTIWDQRFMQSHGLSPEAPTTLETWIGVIHPDDQRRVRMQLDQFRAVGGAGKWEMEYRVQTPLAGEKWILTLGRADRRHGGRLIGLKGICLDITFRKTHEERLRMLMRESNHRKKNLLAVVMGIARNTVAHEPADFLERFQARIHSLAAGYDLLINNAWRGVDLRQMLNLQLAHFGDIVGRRIFMEGPPVQISASIAQPLGMALHELATNASKYGSLSNDVGEVRISWMLSAAEGLPGEPEFRMSWVERGGPPVAKPVRKGYGTAVTGKMIEMTVNGTVVIKHDKRGLSWTLSCPARNLIEDDGMAQPVRDPHQA